MHNDSSNRRRRTRNYAQIIKVQFVHCKDCTLFAKRQVPGRYVVNCEHSILYRDCMAIEFWTVKIGLIVSLCWIVRLRMRRRWYREEQDKFIWLSVQLWFYWKYVCFTLFVQVTESLWCVQSTSANAKLHKHTTKLNTHKTALVDFLQRRAK